MTASMEEGGGSSTRPLFATVAYAEAFGLGSIDVPEWQTALLKRSIPGTEWFDALSCYPVTVFGSEIDLEGGRERLRAAGLVSVALVPDPIASPSPDVLSSVFEICRPFKTHYLIDRSAGLVRYSATHRRWIRKASRECEVTTVALRDSLGDWERLYRNTVERHAIAGLQKYSPAYFVALAGRPEVEAFCARMEGEIVAMALWVRSPEIAYYHLGASDARGYKAQAMYGILAAANEHFASCKVLHLGGAAGVRPNEDDGLARFKRGFANREVTAYFCGSSLDPDRYAMLIADQPTTTFFPAYRKP